MITRKKEFLAKIIDLLNYFLLGTGFKTILIQSILLASIVLFLSPPHNITENFKITENKNDYHYYDVILKQIDKIEPLNYSPGTHEKKMEVRVLIPFIFKIIPTQYLTHLPLIIYLINCSCLVTFFFQLIVFQKNAIPNFKYNWLLAISVAPTYLCVSFLIDFWPMFDGIAFLFLLVAANSRTSYNTVLFLLLSLFIDERSLFPALAIILLKYWGHENKLKPYIIGTILLIIFVTARIALTYKLGLSSLFYPSDDISPFLYVRPGSINLFILSILGLFKILNILIIIVFIRSLKKSSVYLSIQILTISILILVGAFCVADFTRSLCYIFPIFLYAIVYFIKNSKLEIKYLTRLFTTVFIVNFFIPTTFYHSELCLYTVWNFCYKILFYIWLHI